MRNVLQLGRRTWLARTGSGLLAVWAGLATARGQGWQVLLGTPAVAEAGMQDAPRILDASIDPVLPGMGPLNVRAFVVVRGREAALVDALLPGNVNAIQDVLRTAGLGFDALKHVILTHYHPDHSGSAADIAALAGGATWYAGAPDIPPLTAGIPDFGVPPFRKPIQAIAEGSEVFGLRIVATPGHTAGHVSVFEPSGSAMVIGDAAFNLQGLSGSPPQFTADLVAAGESVRKLAGMNFQRALFSHGPPINEGAAAALAQFLQRYPRASDGQSLEHQSWPTQAAFATIHGDQAGVAWVREHEAELRRGSVGEPEASPRVCCPFEVQV
jgi:glyoxylase-like metal-dependent hydrolase (beta-lactamase superfamily II)